MWWAKGRGDPAGSTKTQEGRRKINASEDQTTHGAIDAPTERNERSGAGRCEWLSSNVVSEITRCKNAIHFVEMRCAVLNRRVRFIPWCLPRASR